jgi:cytosine/adenosine deaminase-related metal-dependent hydrolase
LEAIAKAEDEMYLNGIVAVGDICNNTITIPQKSKGRIYYHNFIEASGYHPSVAAQRFQRSLEIFTSYAENYSIPVEANSIVPHAPYSVSDELWDRIISFPGNHLFSMHNQESAEENEWFVSKTGNLHEMYQNLKINTDFFHAQGKTSLQCCLPKFLRNQQLILVHNVHTDYKDLQFAKTYKESNPIFWCFCPNANQYISRSLPPIQLFMDHNCDIVLGTDSLASNHQLSILEEMRTLKNHFRSLPLDTLLNWATINGARALQCESFLGSFEKGKMPGVVRLDEDLGKIERLV